MASKRQVGYLVLLTTEEREELHRRAKTLGVSVSAMVRRVLGFPDTRTGRKARPAATRKDRQRLKAASRSRR